MSRKKRIWYPGATYHVMSRGNRRTALFKEQDDYLVFLTYLKRAQELYGFKIHSLCLMTNHFHLALETNDIQLSKIMQKILHPYSMEFNHKYNFTGHVFESRYTACLVENERYFLEVSRYIHLNPVKAQMVRNPIDYKYSSYDLFVLDITQSKTDIVEKTLIDILDTSRVLSAFRNNSKEEYRMFVEGKISHAEQEMLIQKDIKEDDMWLQW